MKILRELRTEKGFTQKQLGDMIGVSPITVKGWETLGKEPDYDTLCKIAKIFDVTVGQLLGVEEY